MIGFLTHQHKMSDRLISLDELADYPRGTKILTYGRGVINPFEDAPWREDFWTEVAKEILYSQIRAYQKRLEYALYLATHAQYKSDDWYIIEATLPDVQENHIESLVGKDVALCVPLFDFDVSVAIEWLRAQKGRPYDKLELLDFAIGGWLKLPWLRPRILDRTDRYTCSPLCAVADTKGGFEYDIPADSVPPAHFENKPLQHKVTYAKVIG